MEKCEVKVDAERVAEIAGAVPLALTHGLAVGGKLRENRIVEVTAMGITFLGDLSFDQCVSLLAGLKHVQGAFHICLADVLAYMRQRFSDEAVENALVQLEFEMSDVAQATAIAAVPRQLRAPGLTSEHYFVVARADLTVDQQKRWLRVASEKRLTGLELKRSIERGEVVKERSGNSQSGIVTIQGIRYWFERWAAKMGGEEQILHWEADFRRKWLEEVKPIIELAHKVEESLS